MYKFLARRIKDGYITINDVPKKYRKKVQEELDEIKDVE